MTSASEPVIPAHTVYSIRDGVSSQFGHAIRASSRVVASEAGAALAVPTISISDNGVLSHADNKAISSSHIFRNEVLLSYLRATNRVAPGTVTSSLSD